MTNAQLKQLLRWAIPYVHRDNEETRYAWRDPGTGQILNRSIAMRIAKTDIWLSKARKAVARPKAPRKPK